MANLTFKTFLEKYERRLSSLALIVGFVIDNLTLRRVDYLLENLLLVAYLALAAICIVLINAYEAGKLRNAFFTKLHSLLPIVMQFSFGGLFSAFFVFYLRSASIEASWPFLVLLLGYLIGNELMRKNYVRFGFQITVFFIALFSFLIFFIPVVLKMVGALPFILSGIVSIFVIRLFIRGVGKIVPARAARGNTPLLLSIALSYIALNVLYFSNIIPPIPLSLKAAGVYHSIERAPDGDYILEGEGKRRFEIFRAPQTIHIAAGETLYAFTSVFAPSGLSTDIVHNWQYYDESTEEWTVSDSVRLRIVGGRDGGYRTYSVKKDPVPGLWRVSVETPRGQLIGRLTFNAVIAEEGRSLRMEKI